MSKIIDDSYIAGDIKVYERAVSSCLVPYGKITTQKPVEVRQLLPVFLIMILICFIIGIYKVLMLYLILQMIF